MLQVHAYSVQLKTVRTKSDLVTDGKKRPYPEGFSKLLDQMAVFYQKHGQQASFAFRSLDDVADTFIAVHVPLHGKYWWLRGIIMDFQKAVGVLKVRKNNCYTVLYCTSTGQWLPQGLWINRVLL